MSPQLQAQPFDQAIVAAYPNLLCFARKLARSDADARDLVQAAIERGLSRRADFRYGTTPNKWIASILRRLFIDGYRHARIERQLARRHDPVLEDRLIQHPATDEREGDGSAIWEAFSTEDVRRASMFLSPALRAAYTLFTFEQLSYDQIAVRLSLAAGTVASRVCRARKQLRDLLLCGDFLMPAPAAKEHARRCAKPKQLAAAATPPAAPPEAWVGRRAA